MYKVFINERAITLTDKYEDYKSNYDCLFLNYEGANEALFDSVELLSSSDVVSELCVYTNDLDKLWTNFKERYKMIEAAGGIVVKDGKVLLIMKNAHWDLPKGKIDGTESLEDAAIREVSEECGLKELSIDESLDVTYYIYKEGEKEVLKKTQWFKMSSATDGPLQGDAKEGITDVQWASSDDWAEKSKASYPSVINLLSSIF